MYWTHFEEKGTFGILRKYMCILWELLFGFLIEPISDLSRVNPCGVYPWLIFYLWKWHHLIPWPVPSDPLLIRITSSGIRASTFDTGSILFDIFFLRILMSHSLFVFCSIIWVLVVFSFSFVIFFCSSSFPYVHLLSLLFLVSSTFVFTIHNSVSELIYAYFRFPMMSYLILFLFSFSIYSIRFRFSVCLLDDLFVLARCVHWSRQILFAEWI